MLYTIFWLIMWLLLGESTFTFGEGGAFFALVIAVLADILYGYHTRWWVRRP